MCFAFLTYWLIFVALKCELAANKTTFGLNRDSVVDIASDMIYSENRLDRKIDTTLCFSPTHLMEGSIEIIVAAIGRCLSSVAL